MPRGRLLGRLRRIEGLDGLPTCWLADLAWWAEKHPEIAGVVHGVAVRERLLLARLHPLTAWTGDAAVWIPAMIKRWVYPPLWRPLRRAQRARLMAERAGPPRDALTRADPLIEQNAFGNRIRPPQDINEAISDSFVLRIPCLFPRKRILPPRFPPPGPISRT